MAHLDKGDMHVVGLEAIHEFPGDAGGNDAIFHPMKYADRAADSDAARRPTHQHQMLSALLKEGQGQGSRRDFWLVSHAVNACGDLQGSLL
jgi:hypothetical protein